jgi:peroxiredoxin Q/BCP
MLVAGELAPDFELTAHDGSRVRLSDLAGSYVLLWFYPMADTPG